MTDRAPITNDELERWANVRADDAGHLARELIVYRRAATRPDAASPDHAALAMRERCKQIAKPWPGFPTEDSCDFKLTEVDKAVIKVRQDIAAAIDALELPAKAASDCVREALEALEQACEKLAKARTQSIYDAMINGGQAQALSELDNARLNARKILGHE